MRQTNLMACLARYLHMADESGERNHLGHCLVRYLKLESLWCLSQLAASDYDNFGKELFD